MIRLERITKKYRQAGNEIHVLNELNFEVTAAKRVAIVGQSGSGKSTLLSIAACLDSPDSGHVFFGDTEMTNLSEKELASFRSKNIGIVFQDFHLLSSFTALENVMLPLQILSTPDSLERAKEALDKVGLGSRISHFPHELSGGECQRVAIARSIVSRPSVMFADEPSGSLDSETGDKVMDLTFAVAEENQACLVLVTHNLLLAKKCDEIYQLQNGKLDYYPCG